MKQIKPMVVVVVVIALVVVVVVVVETNRLFGLSKCKKTPQILYVQNCEQLI